VVVSAARIVSAAKAVLAGRPEVPRRLQVNPTARPAAQGATAATLRPAGAAPAAGATHVAGVPLVMPNQDLTITEARVLQWLKQVGDSVAKDEPVVEVETDKAVMTVDAPIAGKLAEIVAPAESVVLLGQQLGTIVAKE
jgi:2-oxoglutarate dehydrogenase E2 component (dihydrolipoamide succinyltransferase)